MKCLSKSYCHQLLRTKMFHIKSSIYLTFEDEFHLFLIVLFSFWFIKTIFYFWNWSNPFCFVSIIYKLYFTSINIWIAALYHQLLAYLSDMELSIDENRKSIDKRSFFIIGSAWAMRPIHRLVQCPIIQTLRMPRIEIETFHLCVDIAFYVYHSTLHFPPHSTVAYQLLSNYLLF